MYNKIISDPHAVVHDYEEVIIGIEGTRPEDVLFYRDEGNMNIVVSLYADDHEEKYVIRFKKIAVDLSPSNDHKHELMSFVRFEELLQKYFDRFTVVPKIVYLDIDIGTLNEFLVRDRPAVRRSKIIGHNYGLLYRDVAFLPKEVYTTKPTNGEFRDSPTICIEIKVKQGYVMNDSKDYDFNIQKCRFCYFQYLKLKNAKITNVSKYCPIDLFSGNAERMNRAIKGLFENPQNNLKMFQNGETVYNEYTQDKKALRRILEKIFPDVVCSERQEMMILNLIRKILLKDFTCCDSKIEMCSNANISDIKDVHTRSCLAETSPQLPTNCILSSILKAQMLVRDNFERMELLENNEDDFGDDCSQIIQDYRIGSTALDCSVMVTFRRINETNFDVERDNLIDGNHYVTFNGPNGLSPQHFAVSATIVDLDEKKDSFAHFRKYKKQYRDSIVAYKDYMKARRFN